MAWDPNLGRSPKNMAEILFNIYNSEFGGKKQGRFRTSRNNFRKIANIPLITDDYLAETSLWLRKYDLILINLDNAFCIFPLSSTESFRRVPESVISQYLESNDRIDSDLKNKIGKEGRERAWQILAGLDPQEVCNRINVTFDESSKLYSLPLFGHSIFISVEKKEIYGHSGETDLLLNKLKQHSLLPILHFLISGKNIPPSKKYAKLRDLLAGKVESKGTHTIPLKKIAGKYGSDTNNFLNRGRQFGGEPSIYGDASILLAPFPGVPIVIILWAKDDEFSARADLLIDSNCGSQMPPDIIWMIFDLIAHIMLLDSEFA